MSSDDEFEIDFVSNATNTVKSKWSKTNLVKDSKNDLTDVTNTYEDEVPIKKKKGGTIKDFVDSPMDKVSTSTKNSQDSSGDEVVTPRKSLKDRDVSLTPPGSPGAETSAASARRVRGERRTKKTEQALKKIQKSKQTTAALRNSHHEIDYEERQAFRPRVHNAPLDESFDLKIRWRHKILKIEVKQEDTMTKVLEFVAKEAGTKATDINIYLTETSFEPLSRRATIRELKLSLISILHARARVAQTDSSNTIGEGSFEIKLQTKDRRSQPVMIKIRGSDTMETVVDKFCAQSSSDKDKVKLFFDGELVKLDQLAEDLELEDGDSLDVHISN